MKLIKYLLLSIGLLLAAGLAGCSLGDDLPLCEPAGVSAASNYPNYRRPPADLSPPDFSWTYHIVEGGEVGGEIECNPAFQHIRFGTRTFDEAGNVVLTGLEESDLLGFSREWTATIALTPGTHYFWEVTWYGEGGTDPHSQVWAFNSGPTCDRTELLPPLILSLPDGAVVEAPATVSWEFPGGCTPEGLVFAYSTTPETDPARMDVWHYPMAVHGMSGFEACQEYYWTVASSLLVPPTDIFFLPDPPGFPWAEPLEYDYTGFLFSEYTAIRRFYVIGDACPVAPDGFGPLLSVGPSLPPRVRIPQEINCRSGPTTDYPVRSILLPGNEYEIQARNTLGDSWMILDPAINDSCWVFGDLVEVIGDTSLVNIINPDPPPLVLPTDTQVVNCSQYTSPLDCGNNSACYWDPNDPPNSNGSCKNK